MPRRVVVTGVGLITALGLNTEETWKGVLAGRSGMGPITHFDATRFSCRIAAEVQGFDPLRFIERKEIKKVGQFIQFAIAASEEALRLSGLKITPENCAFSVDPASAAVELWPPEITCCTSSK